MARPLILVTNDDGITAPGIQHLVEAASKYGEVVVVAPNAPQSAMGHAITIQTPLRVYRSRAFEEVDVEAYECSGTPVDCVKLSKSVILKGRTPDLCLSGINHGSNASINIIYSGTLSAAMEASLEAIPSIGFSLLDYSHDADFKSGLPYVQRIIEFVLEHGMDEGSLFNVNIPKLSTEEIKGIKVCRQADARWVEEFAEAYDPQGQPYYWLTGRFVNDDQGTDTDVWALENGYISLVPSHHDLTNYRALPALKTMESLHSTSEQFK